MLRDQKTDLIALTLGVLLSGCSQVSPKGSQTAEPYAQSLTSKAKSHASIQDPIEYTKLAQWKEGFKVYKLEGLEDLNLSEREFTIPVEVNKQVLQWMKYFTGRGRKVFTKYLERSGALIPHMLPILKESEVPPDLIFLAMIESGFNQRARSRASAVGPWQFMKHTARLYNLKVNWWVDERKDPFKSTLAAATHLRDLYEQFDDWYLAAAAYNAGARKVSKAIHRYQTRDFWKLSSYRKRYLKRETKNYVPKMIAAAIISKNLKSFGFIDLSYEPLITYDIVEANKTLDLYKVSEALNIEFDDLIYLNPEIVRWTTPVTDQPYFLRIPKGQKAIFLANYDQDSKPPFAKTLIKRATQLKTIAQQFRIPIESLTSLNSLSPSERLSKGTTLMIPIREGHTGREKIYWNDQNRRRYRTLAARSKWLKSKKFTKIETHGGQYQVIRHVVQQGDSLWTISQLYSVSINELKRWNGFRGRTSAKIIRPGDQIRVRVPQKNDASS